MGCGSSKQPAKRGTALQDLAPRPHPGGGFPPEPELSRTELEQALRWTAQYVSQHSKKPITIVAVGGVVNTISLHSRNSTHDVDWFNSGLNKDEVALLTKAANFAHQQAERKKLNIASNWFNNKTVLFIRPNLRQQLVDEALRQNYEVFSAPGLRVIAAPWGYALMAKLDRLTGGGGKPYDASDAANYLHQYLRQSGKRNVPMQTIQQLAHQYQLRLRVEDVRIVNQRYQAEFGEPGVV